MFPQKVAQFFSLRGISQETLKKFNIWWNGKEIVIPIKDERGKTLFNKYRRNPESVDGPKYRNEIGSHITIFNPKALESSTIIIAEGEADVLRLDSIGYASISSTGGAQSFKKEWADILKDKKVYICYDSDEAGVKGAVKIAWLLSGILDVSLIAFPEYFSGKDVTDYLQYHSKDEFDSLIKNAIQLPLLTEKNTKTISKALEESQELRRKLKSLDLSTDIIEEHVAMLNATKDLIKKTKIKRTRDEQLTHVKQVPISEFIQFDPSGFSKRCIWHSPTRDQQTPSLHYYPRTNSVYCFACCKSGDVISVVRELNGCTFIEALDILKKYL